MTKVYVAIGEWDWETRRIISIHTTEEAAQKAADDHSREVNPERTNKMRTYYDTCTVETHEVES